MCDTKFSIYLYSVRFGIRTCAGGHVSLGFSVVGVFKRVFGMGFFSRRVTSAVSFCFSILGLQPRGKAAMLVVNTIQFCFAEFA